MRKEISVDTALVYEPRALAELVGIANEFSSKIFIEMDGRRVNAKSIMGVMGLGLDQNKMITVEVEGEDEEKAIAAIDDFLTR